MKEQVIARRVADRGGASGKRRPGVIAQRPAKRGGGAKEALGDRLRSIVGYLPLAGKLFLVIAVCVLILTGYRVAVSASFFKVQNVEVRGAARASAAEIQSIVRHQAGEQGLWRADLSGISAQIERLPWVRTAVVTRVLPDVVRVRIAERVQRAIVRTAAGRLVWVDDDAVLLGPTSATDQMPAFFLRGWNEDKSEEAVADNRERVQKYLQLSREWEASGIANRVSEVNLSDLRDVRAQLAGDDSQIEVRLGADDLGPRLEKGLQVLDAQRQTPLGPFITYIIMSQKSPIVGHSVAPNISKDVDSVPGDEPKTKVKSAISSIPQERNRATGADSAKDQPVLKQTGDSRNRRVNEPRSQHNR
jgi:cell division septal protein FtsQ